MWSQGRIVSAAVPFLQKRILQEEEFSHFMERKGWLETGLREQLSKINEALVEPTVLLYGSAVAGTAFLHGDADFSIAFRSVGERLPSEKIGGFHVVQREAQPEILGDVYVALKGYSDKRFQRIFRARVPILQFSPELSGLQGENAQEVVANSDSPILSRSSSRLHSMLEKKTASTPRSQTSHRRQHIDISLSINGCRNSVLIREYMRAFPFLRVLTMVIKQWGRHQKILNARGGWLSPYALTVMVIHYASEKRLIPDLVDETQVDNQLESAQAYLPFAEADMSVAEDGLEVALKGFFDYYSKEFDFDTDVVDIRVRGRILQKPSWFTQEEQESLDDAEKWHRLGHSVITIRDPFENHSLGRSVDFFRAEAIREAFRLAADGISTEIFSV